MRKWKRIPISLAIKIKGMVIEGDREVPPTKWYNILWMLLFGWKTVAVLSAQSEEEEWYIGFEDFHGNWMLCQTPILDNNIAVKIGRESCRFFAISGPKPELMQELPLTLVARARVI
ncbi:MAG: hypothetical protein NTZ18_02115 [Candidatus Komeilibacteria bacterium]|nr:hypothetical protein [Candidatus Komeilibacteria bacterium]